MATIPLKVTSLLDFEWQFQLTLKVAKKPHPQGYHIKTNDKCLVPKCPLFRGFYCILHQISVMMSCVLITSHPQNRKRFAIECLRSCHGSVYHEMKYINESTYIDVASIVLTMLWFRDELSSCIIPYVRHNVWSSPIFVDFSIAKLFLGNFQTTFGILHLLRISNYLFWVGKARPILIFCVTDFF